ncbi:TDT family transporter [Streptomyces nigra]|uniref:SLAC1 family transporter n=1 Tax=Streptomyces nigra TaxID=1827580 RepID=UPI0036B57FB0
MTSRLPDNRRLRQPLPTNAFGISFGLCGLGGVCTRAHEAGLVQSWLGDIVWLLAAAAWTVTLVVYGARIEAWHLVRSAVADPVQGPFASLAAIVPMLLGVALARYSLAAGQAVFTAGLVLTVGFGSWITAQWISTKIVVTRLHPGYSLPTVTGGLLAAAGSAELGHRTLAYLMLGYGALCWVMIGPMVLSRLVAHPPLPNALLPTLAIELTPPVVAGNAWLTINGGRVDALEVGLMGHAMFMMLVQVALLPTFRKTSFGLSHWAFGFSYTTAAALGIRYMAAETVAHRQTFSWLLIGAAIACTALLAARTTLALVSGTLLPRSPSHS